MKTLIILIGMTIITAFSPVPPKKKVIFLGDSLTQAGAEPGGYIGMLREKLQRNGLSDKYELIGKGVGGNRIRELLARVERDVIDQKPDLVFIMVGINDVGFFTWHPEDGGTPADQYELGLTYLVKRIRQKGSDVVLCTPTVIEERYNGKNPLDKQLDQYAAIVRKVARKNQCRLCDMRKAFVDYLKIHNPENKLKDILTTDYVHLNANGNTLVMENMIKFL